MPTDQETRKQLVALMRGGQAFMPFDRVIADFPPDAINRKPPNTPYSFWHLLEHLRIAQRDILDYVRGVDDYEPHEWPSGYWLDRDATTDVAGWNHTIEQFNADKDALIAIVEDPQTDVTAPLPHAPQHNVLRQILIVADHNAYHTGEFAILRGVMQLWPAE